MQTKQEAIISTPVRAQGTKSLFKQNEATLIGMLLQGVTILAENGGMVFDIYEPREGFS